MPWLGSYVGHDTPACDAVRADLGDNDDDDTGDYTAFWAERDYLKTAAKVKASVFMTHGLSDYNVQTNHFSQWWTALAKNKVPRKLWLGLEDHVDPFEFRRDAWVDELHEWFDYWLQGLQNGVMKEPMASVETAPDVWRDYKTWPAVNRTLPVPLAAGKLGAPGKETVTITDAGTDRGRHRRDPVPGDRRPADVPVRTVAGTDPDQRYADGHPEDQGRLGHHAGHRTTDRVRRRRPVLRHPPYRRQHLRRATARTTTTPATSRSRSSRPRATTASSAAAGSTPPTAAP